MALPYVALAMPFPNPTFGAKSATGKFLFKGQFGKGDLPVYEHGEKYGSLTAKGSFFVARAFGHVSAHYSPRFRFFGDAFILLVALLRRDAAVGCLNIKYKILLLIL